MLLGIDTGIKQLPGSRSRWRERIQHVDSPDFQRLRMRLTEPNMINVVLLGHIDQGWFTALDHCRHVAYNFIFNLDTNTLGSSQRLSDNVQRMPQRFL